MRKACPGRIICNGLGDVLSVTQDDNLNEISFEPACEERVATLKIGKVFDTSELVEKLDGWWLRTITLDIVYLKDYVCIK